MAQRAFKLVPPGSSFCVEHPPNMPKEPHVDALLRIAEELVRGLLRTALHIEPGDLLDPSLSEQIKTPSAEPAERVNCILVPVTAYVAFVQTGNTKSAEENGARLDELCEEIFKGIQKADFQIIMPYVV
jgi:hypothetical protein